MSWICVPISSNGAYTVFLHHQPSATTIPIGSYTRLL